MNQYDKQNLKFLLGASPEVLTNWYQNTDDDDHEYAGELLKQYQDELRIRETFNVVESINLDSLVPDATEYLKRFTLGKH
jgi:hypothetical protein